MLRSIFGLSALVLFSAAGFAQTTWTVQLTFNDGGTGSGTFVYNAVTNVYSAVNLVTTAGTIRAAGTSYHFVCGSPDIPACGDSFSPLPNGVAFAPTNAADQTGSSTLYMEFNPPLYPVLDILGLGGPILSGLTGFTGNEGTCQSSVCTVTSADPQFRRIVGGTVTPSPEPSFVMQWFFS